MNAIIVDDEVNSRESLHFLLEKYCPEIAIKGVAASGAEARILLALQKIDLVFLDIAMPRESGFDFLESIENRNFLVVFVTASHEHAFRAIKASAVDYILKPVNIAELKAGVAKAKILYELKQQFSSLSSNYQASLTGLIRNLTKGERLQKITLPFQQGFVSVDADEIKYLRAEDNYTMFYLAKDKSLMASRTLKDFEDALDERNFVRVHKSFLINLSFLKRFDTSDTPTVILDEDISIPVSKRRVKEFNEKWEVFARGTSKR